MHSMLIKVRIYINFLGVSNECPFQSIHGALFDDINTIKWDKFIENDFKYAEDTFKCNIQFG